MYRYPLTLFAWIKFIYRKKWIYCYWNLQQYLIYGISENISIHTFFSVSHPNNYKSNTTERVNRSYPMVFAFVSDATMSRLGMVLCMKNQEIRFLVWTCIELYGVMWLLGRSNLLTEPLIMIATYGRISQFLFICKLHSFMKIGRWCNFGIVK